MRDPRRGRDATQASLARIGRLGYSNLVGKNIFYFLIAGLSLYVASGLLVPIVMGAVLAVLFFPWFLRLERRKVPPSVAAGGLTLGIALVLLLPAGLLTFLVAKTGVEQLRHLKDVKDAPHPAAGGDFMESVLRNPWVSDVLGFVTTWTPVQTDEIVGALRDLARGVGVKLADLLGDLVSYLPSGAMALAIVVISIYFFLVDGRRLNAFVRKNSVFSPSQTERLIRSFAMMCRSVILATVASGAAQSVLLMLLLVITGTPNVLLVGFLVFITSFLPLIGALPVTLGVTLHQFILGNTTAGIVLAVGLVLVSLIDNIVRPAVLKGAGNLHPLLAFVAAFGGLQTIGFAGVFLGPVIAGLFVVALEIVTEDVSARR